MNPPLHAFVVALATLGLAPYVNADSPKSTLEFHLAVMEPFVAPASRWPVDFIQQHNLPEPGNLGRYV